MKIKRATFLFMRFRKMIFLLFIPNMSALKDRKRSNLMKMGLSSFPNNI